MVNKSRRIGTEGENWWLEHLVGQVWPGSDRSSAGTPSNDYHGPPIPVEAKRRKVLEIPKWTRTLTALYGNRWLLLCSPRDRRRVDRHPDLVVMPVEFAREVLAVWEEHR